MGDVARLTITTVNELDDDAFVAVFGEVFEGTASLAAAAFERGPFADRDDLIAAFELALGALDADAELALLQAHPVLGARAPMAAASVEEQASAGLQDLDADLREQIATDNARYLERFGFPFIIAVRGLAVAEIAAAVMARLAHPADVERKTALEQVGRIAALRIERLVE